MALATNHVLPNIKLYATCTSVASSPVPVYFRIPFRCQVKSITSVISGAITVANASCALTVNGGSTAFTHTIVQSGSAAGQLDNSTITPNLNCAQNDVLCVTPSGATGSSIQAFFEVNIAPN